MPSHLYVNDLYMASVDSGHIFQTNKVTYHGVLNPKCEVKLTIALSPRLFSSPTAQN